MTSKTTTTRTSMETITVAAAFAFVIGLVFHSNALFVGAALLLALRFSLHLMSFARPVPSHFRQHRANVRYTR
jgi:hypothetical protein